MTLVAGISFGGTLAFIGDLLTSWRLPTKIDLPTRPEKDTFGTSHGDFVAGLEQKLIIVRPYLLLAWAGSVSVVHKLARQLGETLPFSIKDLYGREEALFAPLNELPASVEVVAIVIDGNYIRPYCVHTRGFEIDGKRFYLLGTGGQTIFDYLVKMTRDMPVPDNSDGIAARMVLINFAANALMAQFQSGYGISESWGGGFEVAYVTKDGFAKVDNILVRCWSLSADGLLGNIGRSFLIHYQGSSLLLSSFGTEEKTTIVRSPIDAECLPPLQGEIVPEWTVDLFWRPEDNKFFHAVQMEYPWSTSNSKFQFEDGNIVAWSMDKSRVEKIIEKINLSEVHPSFQMFSL